MRHALSRLLRLSYKIIEVGYLMARFVAVPISSFGKHRVELGLKLLLATQHLHQSIDILRHIPSVMTGGTFRDIRLTMDKVLIILEKTTIRLFPTHLLRCMTTVTVACLGVDDMTPVLRTTHQFGIILIPAQCLCHLSHRKVIEGILQRA